MMSRASTSVPSSKLRSRQTSTTPSLSASTEAFSAAPPFKISIHQSDTDSLLPQVKVTLKQEPDKQALSRLRSTFRSPSWGGAELGAELVVGARLGAREGRSERAGRSQRAVDEDSVRELLAQPSDEHLLHPARATRQGTHLRGQGRGGELHGLGRQPRMERVRQWVHTSPLASARPVDDSLMNELQQQKLSRRVHFEGGYYS